MKQVRFTDWYRRSFLGRLFSEERAQVLPLMSFFLLSMLGMGALSLDFGRAYVSFHQLQSATDAAALAGAEQLPSTSAITEAQTFSASSGDNNHYNWMSNVSTTVTGKCLSTLTSQGLPCIGGTGNESANAIQVTSSFSVPTYFARLFGINSIPIAWTSTASMNGSASTPWNIAIIVDTTQSMNDTDSDSQCSSSRISCALTNVQQFLLSQNVAPLSVSGTALDEVALFTFPNVTTGTVAYDSNCSGTNPTIGGHYQFPVTSDTSYTNSSSPPGTLLNPSSDSGYSTTYEVVGFANNYKASNSSTTLQSGSSIVNAIGGNGCSPSKAMKAIGGLGTYYAGVIYAAQAALDAERAASGRSLSQNAMIIISDGDATSSCSQMGSSSSTTCPSPAADTATSGTTYPAWKDECSQAITAAQFAASKGTRVYTVAYGAASSGCATDTSGTYSGISPCTAMQDMASSAAYFFSDYTAGQNSGQCIAASQGTSNLTTIFQYIAGTLTSSRLIPNGTT